MSNTQAAVLSSSTSFLNTFYNLLGDRTSCNDGVCGQPGFVRTYSSGIAKLAIITPLVIQVLKCIGRAGSQSDTGELATKSDILSNLKEFAKSNLAATIATTILGTLYFSTKEQPPAVYFGYAVLFASHAYKVIERIQAGSKLAALYHLCCTGIAATTSGIMAK